MRGWEVRCPWCVGSELSGWGRWGGVLGVSYVMPQDGLGGVLGVKCPKAGGVGGVGYWVCRMSQGGWGG